MKKIYIVFLVLFISIPIIGQSKEMLDLQQLRLKEYQTNQYTDYYIDQYGNYRPMAKPAKIVPKNSSRQPASHDRNIPEHRPYEFWDLGMGM